MQRRSLVAWALVRELEFSRRPRRDYNYANALLRGRRERATDVWNGIFAKEHRNGARRTAAAFPLLRGPTIEYKVGLGNEEWLGDVAVFSVAPCGFRFSCTAESRRWILLLFPCHGKTGGTDCTSPHGPEHLCFFLWNLSPLPNCHS